MNSALRAALMGGWVTTQLFALDFTQGVLPSAVSYSATGQRMFFDSNGYLTFAPNNILLNSATLSTQSVTTTPNYYILSFQGTGSVTLSGTSTGTTNGTGVGNRVYTRFKPTAGTLTLTVTGSVTSAQLEAVTYQTTPSSYNATTSSAYYGPRLNSSGLLIEPSATNLAYTNLMTSTNNGASDLTRSTTITGPDGLANSCQTFAEDTANNQHYAALGAAAFSATFSITSGQNYTLSAIVKKGSTSWCWIGSYAVTSLGVNKGLAFFNFDTGRWGTIQSGISRYLATSLGNGFWLLQISFPATANETLYGIRVGTASADGTNSFTGSTSNTLNFYAGQLETGLIATSAIMSYTGSVARSPDSLSANSSLSTALAAGWSIVEWIDTGTGVLSRQAFAPGAFSFASNKIYSKLVVYDPKVTGGYCNTRLTPGGPL